MATDNETGEDIVREIRQVAHNVAVANKVTKENWRPAMYLATVADRIEAAWKREICDLRARIKVAEKQIEELCECLKWARRDLCKGCRDKGFKCKKNEPCMTVLNIDIAIHKALKGAANEQRHT